ncbi:MAG: family 20 glycosylhydrolase [Anaerolineae bacterium]|nr:family 20 glycosylhydrolase [Anaerolineae bacterium]MDW8298793.1 family 20 glycosylhydrolase [Anaerolineae bacterium]
MTTLHLLPRPKQLTFTEGSYRLQSGKLISIPSPTLLFTAQRLQTALAQRGIHWQIVIGGDSDQIGVRLLRQSAPTELENAYQIRITTEGITLIGSQNAVTLWHATLTLIQIIQQSAEELPCLHIDDQPDFVRRGVMLDISRDRVPTMQSLYALVDLLASWKINEIQLYTEHTFAYQKHPVVWQHASPMTGEEILALDRFCRERFVDLVPNQNSFGHMHRWLMHPQYRHLAELPEGFAFSLALTPRPFGLSPAVQETLPFLAGLYDELLPHFSSQYFNVGCDETFDLGKGRSKALVEAQGVGRVYLDFLKKVAELVRERGRIMQFWGDIIIQHPELVPELPRDVIALEWGYEANHPFEAHGALFAKSGVTFYVCPGTSSWQSMVGRTTNMRGNLQNAAENGLKHGARGYLITDWGDFGHWQPPMVSYAGYAYGAALSWAYVANKDCDLGTLLNLFAFKDSSGKLGQLALEIGDVYRMVEAPHINSALMVRALFTPLAKIREGKLLWQEPVRYSPEQVRAAMAHMEALAAQLDSTQPADPYILREYRTAIGLWLHGCKRLLKAADDSSCSNAALADELRPLMGEFAANWLARSRSGGLGDSLARMARLLAEYESA